MFKSMKWKLVTMFCLIVVSVIIMVGTFLINNVTSFYHQDFKNQMEKAFKDELSLQLKSSLNTENPTQKIMDVLGVFSASLGIDSFRNYYILDSLGNFIDGSDKEGGKILEKSENIIASMTGKTGSSITKEQSYMDFAYPISNNNNVSYIIYIKEQKDELFDIVRNMVSIILNALGIGMLISIILGIILSYTITTPISSLTHKAEKIASGDFEHKIVVKSKDELGKLTNTFNHMANVLKETLDEIASEKNKFETILQNMADGVIAFNLSGSIIHINNAAKEMLLLEDTENITFDSLFQKLNADINFGELLYLNSDKTIEKQFVIKDKHIKSFFAPFNIERDKIGGVTVVLQDVTKQQKLDNSRREFVANVSHELRTPLTTIKSYTETLIDGTIEDKETQSHFLNVINSEIDRMTRLVKDLLTLSRLDYNKNEYKMVKFSLDKLIKDVILKLKLEANSKEQSLSYSSITEIPQIYGDKDRIEQVIINIITNAIKYTQNGGNIEIFTGCIFDNVYIKIKDNGIGIPKKDLTRIFERFYRVDKARSREYGGTGLGLAIAKEIIEAHSGTINIESELSKGTEVIIKFPISKQNTEAKESVI